MGHGASKPMRDIYCRAIISDDRVACVNMRELGYKTLTHTKCMYERPQKNSARLDIPIPSV